MKPKIPVTNKDFKYTQAGDMDSQYLKWKFVKIRKDMKEEAEKQEEKNVVQLRKKL